MTLSPLYFDVGRRMKYTIILSLVALAILVIISLIIPVKTSYVYMNLSDGGLVIEVRNYFKSNTVNIDDIKNVFIKYSVNNSANRVVMDEYRARYFWGFMGEKIRSESGKHSRLFIYSFIYRSKKLSNECKGKLISLSNLSDERFNVISDLIMNEKYEELQNYANKP
jgi:hypothetical protein